LRYRVGQAAALFVLSALGIAACAFGPLYEAANQLIDDLSSG